MAEATEDEGGSMGHYDLTCLREEAEVGDGWSVLKYSEVLEVKVVDFDEEAKENLAQIDGQEHHQELQSLAMVTVSH